MPELSSLAALARRHDPDRFLCALFAPPARREAMFALIAFNHELARAREAASNPLAALIRLTWWREAVEEAMAGKPPRAHEVAGPLHALLAAGTLDARDLISMAEAREAEAEPFPTRAAFEAYLRGAAGGFMVAAGRLLGASGEALAGLQALGAICGEAGVLRNLEAAAAQGRCLLPEDALAAVGLDLDGVIAKPARAVGLRAEMAKAALPRLAAARAALRLPRGAVAAALPAVLAARDLKRMARGVPVAAARGLGDRVAVIAAGLRGRA
jgi:phytoene synthase